MTVFTFSQSSASIPGVQVQASIEINGTFADLPTISSSLPNPDFGNLISFSLSQNVFGNPSAFTLANFMSPGYGANDYYNWSISPGEIFFSGGLGDGDSFEITGLTSNLTTIHLDSDGPSNPACHDTGTCYATRNVDRSARFDPRAHLAVAIITTADNAYRADVVANPSSSVKEPAGLVTSPLY